MIKFTIPLPPRTKKNSLQMLMNRKTKKLYPAPSKAFLQYQDAAGWYIPHKHEKIQNPVNVKCLFYMPTEGIVDLSGLQQAIDDILVHYGVLADDNSRIIVSHDGGRVLYDKANPRTEVEITEIIF